MKEIFSSRNSGRPIRLMLLAGLAALAGLGMGAASASAEWTTQAGITYGPGSESNPNLKQLDVYLPAGASAGQLRPVVVYAHGGGWMNGDKANQMSKKPKLFTDAGYIFVSINYRLSPEVSSGSVPVFDPGRLMFPTHPRDAAEAIAWVGRNIASYGGDPDAMVLIGHSAGAHLVSLTGANPAFLNDQGTSLKQILGVVSLDAGALDVVDSATQTTPIPTQNNYLIWNAFGTPSENAVTSRWVEASAITWADPTDPRQMLVTQAARPSRIAENQRMATNLGQPADSVLKVPLGHEGINDAVGDPSDTTGETGAIMAFIADRISSRNEPTVSMTKRPSKIVRVGRKKNGKPRKRLVGFAFKGAGNFSDFECRLDKASFKPCTSPRQYWVSAGGHSFRVRALYPSGRPGAEKLVKFRVKTRPTHAGPRRSPRR